MKTEKRNLKCNWCGKIQEFDIPANIAKYDAEYPGDAFEGFLNEAIEEYNWLIPSVCGGCAPKYLVENRQKFDYTGWFGCAAKSWIAKNPRKVKVIKTLVPRTVYDEVLKVVPFNERLANIQHNQNL